MKRGDARTAALIALGALSLIWGYNWVVMKIAVAYAPPFEFAAMRAFLGGLALLGVMIAMKRPLKPVRPWSLFWLGIFQTAGFIGIVTWAVVAAGVGKVAILSYTMPFWVAMLAWPLLGERLRALQGLAVLVAMAGIAFILDIAHGSGSMLANTLAVVAGISWAIGVVIARHMTRDGAVDVLSMTTWQMLFGGAALVVVALIVPHGPIHWTPAFTGALVYNVFAATALAYVLWIFVLANLPARDASMGTLTNPVVGIFAAWVQLGERPSLATGIGMALVAAGLLLLALAESRRAPAGQASS